MSNHELIQVDGFLKHEQVSKRANSAIFAKHIIQALDGNKLDHLKITLNIKSKLDAEYLIADLNELKEMLEIHKYCF